MADNEVKFIGNLTREPELRFTTGGKGVASFSIAVNKRYMQNGEWVDGEVVFVNCSAWGQLGENIAASLGKGDRIIVVGELQTREYENKDQVTVRTWEVNCSDVGASFKFATAELSRTSRTTNVTETAPTRGRPADPVYGDEETF
jgi:single-strand DNA-binding protein